MARRSLPLPTRSPLLARCARTPSELCDYLIIHTVVVAIRPLDGQNGGHPRALFKSAQNARFNATLDDLLCHNLLASAMGQEVRLQFFQNSSITVVLQLLRLLPALQIAHKCLLGTTPWRITPHRVDSSGSTPSKGTSFGRLRSRLGNGEAGERTPPIMRIEPTQAACE